MSVDTGARLRVVRRFDVAENIVAFELEAANGMPLPAFEAGAHLEIDCDGQARHYSLCSDPADPMRYMIAVQREADGRGGSRYLCESVGMNDLLDVRAPRNHFTLVPSEQVPLLIAGGIGITPILAMAWALHNAGQRFEMHDFATTVERQSFKTELADAPWASNMTRHIGRCDDFAPLVGGFEGRHLYVCGPFAMIDAVLDAAHAMGWPSQYLHFERFAAPAPSRDTGKVPEPPPNTAFEVELASTGLRIAVAADQTVCAALADAGVVIPVSCEQGVCGSCLTRVLGGIPEHRDWLLSAAEQDAGDVFTPCCSRSKTPLLVLDL